MAMEEVGLECRVTMDLDIVLCNKVLDELTGTYIPQIKRVKTLKEPWK
jgi:hypothetical protein